MKKLFCLRSCERDLNIEQQHINILCKEIEKNPKKNIYEEGKLTLYSLHYSTEIN